MLSFLNKKQNIEANNDPIKLYMDCIEILDIKMESSEFKKYDNSSKEEYFNKNEQHKAINDKLSTDVSDKKQNSQDHDQLDDVLNKFHDLYKDIEISEAQNSNLLIKNKRILDEQISKICNNFSVLNKVVEQNLTLKENIESKSIDYEKVTEKIKTFNKFVENSVVETTKVCEFLN